MIAGIEQALLLELAFDLHQEFAAAAQQRHADRLVVDEGAAAAVGGDLPAQDQRRGVVDALLAQQREDRMIRCQAELGGDAGLGRAGPHQSAFSPPAERQAERIQEDGFAGAGFAGQRRQPGAEGRGRAGR